MLRLQIALWLRVRYVRGSFVNDRRPHGSCAVSLICEPSIESIKNTYQISDPLNKSAIVFKHFHLEHSCNHTLMKRASLFSLKA